MKFEFSPYIAFQVKNYKKAVKFYEKIIGMEKVKDSDNETQFKCGPINFFVENNPGPGGNTFFEFKVDKVSEVLKKLESEGCKVTQIYSDKSVMVADPYGMCFHIWEE